MRRKIQIEKDKEKDKSQSVWNHGQWILNGTLLEDTLGPALGRDERLSV